MAFADQAILGGFATPRPEENLQTARVHGALDWVEMTAHPRRCVAILPCGVGPNGKIGRIGIALATRRRAEALQRLVPRFLPAALPERDCNPCVNNY
jgi:hypothetical protein